jgi:hypothetical protein
VGFKAFIVLVWSLVPLSLIAFYRADHRQFMLEGETERQLCRERITALRHHAGALGAQAATLSNAQDLARLQTWRLLWRSMEEDFHQDVGPLPPQSLSHYPRTATVLEEQSAELTALATTMDNAARDQGYFLHGEETLTELADEIDHLGHQSEFYRRIGEEAIFLQLQDYLARDETHFADLQREQQRLGNSIQRELSQAQHSRAQVESALNMVSNQLADDERLTYADVLWQRWENFDLKHVLTDELAALAGAPPPEPQASRAQVAGASRTTA